MNTKVKVGIAAAIVAALVALIVLDQKTTPKDDMTAKPAPGGEAISVGGNGADAPATRLRDDEINTLLQDAQKQFNSKPAVNTKPASGTGIKSSEEKNEKRIPSATGEEYAIREGDTLESIAKTKYGNASYACMIAEANPGLKATALRVGKKISLPAKGEKAEKKEDIAVAPPPAQIDVKPVPSKQPDALQVVGDKKIYTVQPGDTLSGISVKVYNTSRHYQKIYEANKDEIGDPNTLQVGLKLTMPDLPSKPAAANGAAAGAVATTNPAPANVPAGAKVVQVSEGSSLWKIAEKFAAEKKIGIHEMIKLIVAANSDKLKDEGTLLRLGWQLVIPE
ncbi:MAG: LysM peptidoglycan-binding domain-containing protein [Planctomycetes bacterium]|nr:LysM peptidoglycan-binding domain-containing protein [Planctomycetota bacterium]